MAIQEVEITAVDPQFDVEGRTILTKIGKVRGLEGVRTARAIWLEGISAKEAEILARQVLTNPLTEKFTVNAPTLERTGQIIQIGYRPEMTDPSLQAYQKVAQLHGLNLQAVSSSTIYSFEGNLTHSQLRRVSKKLYNSTIQRVITKKPETLIIKGTKIPAESIPIRNLTPSELKSLSSALEIFLDDDQIKAVQVEFIKLNREPTMAELQHIGGAWSDHCVHTTTNADIFENGVKKDSLFKMIQDTAKKHFKGKVLSAFEDNAGFYDFYAGMAINAKGETHIHPSSLDPIGGTQTGLGGVERDINEAGKGAKVIFSRDHYSIAPLNLPGKEIPKGCLPPLTILRGVVEGAGSYGNPLGVPNFLGSIHFDPEFRARPTVLVVSYGITERKNAYKGHPRPGDKVVVIGGKTGNDGIHGATGSSVEMHGKTAQTLSTSVQIGNPLGEKRMFDGVLDLSRKNLGEAYTDLGALGLGSAIGEMGKETGVRVDVGLAPLKTKGLEGWKIWVSESQERGLVAIAPHNLERSLALLRRRNVEVTVLGEFTNDRKLIVFDGKEKIIDLSYDFLENNLPTQKFEAQWVKPERKEVEPSLPTDWVSVLKKVISDKDCASKEEIQRRYDYGVQGTTVLAPFTGINRDCPNDAVIKAPILGKPYGLVEAAAKNPRLSLIDPYQGSILVSTLAMTRLVAHGGNPNEAYWINNYISGKIRTPEMMGLMHRCVKGVCDSMDIFNTPVISGKDSFSSGFTFPDGHTENVLPYVGISASGPIPDIKKTVSSDIKEIGSILVLVGKQDLNMGGSVYYKVNGVVGNELPEIDGEIVNRVHNAMYQAIQTGKIMSSKAVGEGGVATTIAQMCFGGDCGIEIKLPENTGRPDHFLFNETPGIFVVEVKDAIEAKELFGNVPYTVLGTTTPRKDFRANFKNQELFSTSMNDLEKVWKEPIGKIFA